MISTPLIRRTCSFAFTVAMIAGANGCNSSKVSAPSQVASTIALSAGVDGQKSPAGSPTTTGVSVIVLQQDSAAALNAAVTWSVIAGGGTVSAATSTANASGVAAITWTLGTVAGTNVLQATIASGASVTITATGIAGAVAALTIKSGNNQTVALGATTAPMVLQATDKYGNIISGLTVLWGASGGTLSAPSSTTDATGSANVLLSTDMFTRNYLVTATAGNLTAAYTVTAN